LEVEIAIDPFPCVHDYVLVRQLSFSMDLDMYVADDVGDGSELVRNNNIYACRPLSD
jgi:hypothetical protein